MPTNVNRTATIISPDGSKFQVPAGAKAEQRTEVSLVCDSGKCATRRGVAEPTQVSWVEEEVKANADLVPAELFNFIKLVINMEGGQMRDLSFCCPSCLRDYMQYEYIPISKPKMQLVQKPDTTGALPNSCGTTATHVLPGEPTQEDLDQSVTEAHPLVPMSQPDGLVEA